MKSNVRIEFVGVSAWLGTTKPVKDRHIAGRYSGLYNFDAVAYESLILGIFTIYRCKGGPAPGNKYSALQCPNEGPDGSDLHNHSEFDSIFLGFSRDGFHFNRPGAGEPWPAQGYNISQQYRVPFAPEASSFNRSRWNFAEVLSYAGALAVHPTTLQLFLSGRSGFGEKATGCATLRRDGFASMKTTGRAGGSFTTKPLILGRGRHLFVNLIGTVRVAVLSTGRKVLPGFAAGLSTGAATERVDSTRLPLQWKSQAMLPLLKVGETVSLKFELGLDSEIYSFWVSEWSTGESGGYVAAGGPGFTGSRDLPPTQKLPLSDGLIGGDELTSAPA